MEETACVCTGERACVGEQETAGTSRTGQCGVAGENIYVYGGPEACCIRARNTVGAGPAENVAERITATRKDMMGGQETAQTPRGRLVALSMNMQ